MNNLLFFVVLQGVVLKLTDSAPTADVMKRVSVGFGKAFDECKNQIDMSPEIMEDWHHFWSPDFELKHREVGCLIKCMSEKQELLDENARVHHDNMDDFVRSFPQGEVLAKRMLEIMHACEESFNNDPDDCGRILLSSKCFKEACQKEGIAPTMEMFLIELDL